MTVGRGLVTVLFAGALAISSCSSKRVPTGGPCGGSVCSATEICVSNKCVPAPTCTTDADCPNGGHCHHGVCAACDPAVRCVGSYNLCDPGTGWCTGCLKDGDCPAQLPFCSQQSCVECRTDADCSGGDKCLGGQCGTCDYNVTCGAGLFCTSDNPIVRAGHCTATCAQASDCSQGHPVCWQNAACGTCASDADCPADNQCFWGFCRPMIPGNYCSDPVAVDLGTKAVHLDLGFVDYVERSDGSGSDGYLKVTVPADGLLTVTVAPTSYFGAPSIEGVFHGSCTSRQVIPATSQGTDTAAFPVPKGIVYVDLFADTSDDGYVDLSFKAQPLPVGVDCLSPTPIALDSSLTAHFTVPDVPTGAAVYSLDVPVHSVLQITAADANGQGPEALLQLGSCSDDGVTGTNFRPLSGPLDVTVDPPLDPGRIYLHFTEGNQGPGPYQVTLKLLRFPANETCSKATPLTFNGTDATATGDLTINDALGCDCNGKPGGAGLYYTFSTVGLGAHSVTATVTSSASSSQVAIQSGCQVCTGGPDQVLVCSSAGGTSPAYMPYLPEGQYVVHVLNGTGSFSLDVALGPPYPPPPNDACTSPTVVDLSSGSATVTGDTRGATNTEPYGCAGSAGMWDGRDVVYQATMPGAGRVTATVTPTTSSFDPAIRLDSAPCTTNASVFAACADANGAGAAETVTENSLGSPVFLWVDSPKAPGGAFTAAFTFTPAPANDACAGAIPLAFGATATGDLTGATSTNSCGVVYGNEGDAWYQFTYNGKKTGTATLTLTPAGFNGDIGVITGGCGTTGTCSDTASGTGVGQPVTLAVAAGRGQTFWVRVGAQSGGYGTFTLGLQ